MSVYYNENDPFAAAWLRELMKDGLIASGWVDERSIEDVKPIELQGFTQCHFFAGIGVWSLALRVAGWPDERPIWTGSCPCQPFSAAGKGAGFADERHLWPAWYHLIEHGKRRDVVVVGEQVASKDGRAWYDLVSSDMQVLDHTCGAVDTSAASLGAPFIGQRLYWLAASDDARSQGWQAGERGWCSDQRAAGSDGVVGRLAATTSTRPLPGSLGGIHRSESSAGSRDGESERSSDIGRLAASDSGQCDGRTNTTGGDNCRGQDTGRPEGNGRVAVSDAVGRLVSPDSQRFDGIDSLLRSENKGWVGESQNPQVAGSGAGCSTPLTDTRHGAGIPLHPTEYWRDADWLLCRDPNGARFRPVEPGAFPLVDAGSVVNRLAGVRGAGNALNISQAACFIEAVMEVLDL